MGEIKSLGWNIRQARKEKGLTQQELADIVGVSQNAICEFENDKYLPSLRNWVILDKTLNIGYEQMYYILLNA